MQTNSYNEKTHSHTLKTCTQLKKTARHTKVIHAFVHTYIQTYTDMQLGRHTDRQVGRWSER